MACTGATVVDTQHHGHLPPEELSCLCLTPRRGRPLRARRTGWIATQLVADLVVIGDPDPVGDPSGALQSLLDHQPAAFTTIFGAAYVAVLVVFFAAALRHSLGESAMTTLGYASQSAWPLLSVGSSVFLLATGTAALRVQALSRWLARLTIGLGVLALLGPAAFVFWLVAPLWFAAVGLTLETRP